MKTCTVFAFLILLSCESFAENKNSERFKKLQKIELGFQGHVSESTVKTHNRSIVCAINEWSSYTRSITAFHLQYIDVNLCTHILLRAYLIKNDSFEIDTGDTTIRTDGTGAGWWTKLPELKKQNRNLKLLVSIGGWDQGVKIFQEIASDSQKRAVLVNSAVSFLKKYNFDGINLEWMWPGVKFTEGNQKDQSLLTVLLQSLRTGLKPLNYDLAVLVVGQSDLFIQGYAINKISAIVDYFLLLAIDYAGGWGNSTGHHSPLKSLNDNQDSIVSYVANLIKAGAPAHKLILGIAFFGRTFNLLDEVGEGNGLEKPSQGGFSGIFYEDELEIGYNEICKELNDSRETWSVYRDSDARAPFMRSGAKWVSFDDPQSVREKVAFGISKGLGGYMAWTIDTEDFQGAYCDSNEIKYPLLRTINQELSKHHKQSQRKIEWGMDPTTYAPASMSSKGGVRYLSSIYQVVGLLFLLKLFFIIKL